MYVLKSVYTAIHRHNRKSETVFFLSTTGRKYSIWIVLYRKSRIVRARKGTIVQNLRLYLRIKTVCNLMINNKPLSLYMPIKLLPHWSEPPFGTSVWIGVFQKFRFPWNGKWAAWYIGLYVSMAFQKDNIPFFALLYRIEMTFLYILLPL